MDDFTTVTVYFDSAESASNFYDNVLPNMKGFIEAHIS